MSRFSDWLLKILGRDAISSEKNAQPAPSSGGRFRRVMVWINSVWDSLFARRVPRYSITHHRAILRLEELEGRITPSVTAFDDNLPMSFGTTWNMSAPGVLGNDAGVSLSATLVSQPSHGTVTLNGDGGFTYTHTDLSFAGNDSFVYRASDGTDSATASVFLQIAKGGTTTSVSSSNFSVLKGQPVTITATVSPSFQMPGSPVPSGTVVFTDSSTATTLGSVSLDSFGVATLTTSSLSATIHTILAEYSGSTPYAVSSNTTTVTVYNAITSTQLAASQNSINPGQSVTFTATVSTFDIQAGTPTGSVVFKEGSTTLATSNLNSSGVATFATTNLSAGMHTINAFYTASGWFEDSSATQIVSVGAETINITLPNVTVQVQAGTPSLLTFASLTVGVLDTNPGATLDPSSMTIISQPQGAQATADPETGNVTYTPGSLFSPAILPLNTYGDFQFRIGDSTGATSNVATARIGGVFAPIIVGPIIAHETTITTQSLQSTSVNLLSHIEVFDGAFGDPFNRVGNEVDPSSIRLLERVPITDAVSARHGTASVSGDGVLNYTPDFGYVGPDSIGYQVSDIYGDTVESTVNILVITNAIPRLQADPLGGTMLVVEGTAFADTIVVSPGTKCGEVLVTINGVVSGPFHPTSRIVILGFGGNDNIKVAEGVNTPAWLVGGTGNDSLKAGDGPSVMLGGIGDDTLVAGRGRALLIGGSGSDSLSGNGGDILVADSTIYDGDQAALAAILGTGRSHWGKTGHTHHHAWHSHHERHDCGGKLFLKPSDIVSDDKVDSVDSGGKHNTIFVSTGTGLTDDNVTNLPVQHCKPASPPLSCKPNKVVTHQPVQHSKPDPFHIPCKPNKHERSRSC